MRLSICASAVLATLLITSHVAAQESQSSRPRAEIKMTFGASDFVAGAATRIRVWRNWSVEPEFSYMRRSSNDEDYIFQPNVVYEFHKRGERVVPYLIGGVGYIKHKSVYNDTNFVTGEPVSYDTSYTTWTANAGGGIKIFVSKNLFIAPEARLGIQPTVRATVSIGYTFPVRN